MYDEKRVAQLTPIRTAIENTKLPLVRARKLYGILGAVEVQIEDGGDSPEVNDLLIKALRHAIIFQIDQEQRKVVLVALDRFITAEKMRQKGR